MKTRLKMLSPLSCNHAGIRVVCLAVYACVFDCVSSVKIQTSYLAKG